MKIQFRAANSRCRAVTLIECLVYFSVMTTILAVASVAFYRCYDHMRALRRNTNDITRVLNVGEQWRNDVRQAVRPPSITHTEIALAHERRQHVTELAAPQQWRGPNGVPLQDALRQGARWPAE